MGNGTVMLRLGTQKGSRLCSDGRPAWPIPPSMPESSGIVLSSDGPALDSASCLKERDYIGLAESSTFEQLEAKKDDELRLGGTDLQLELGLGLGTFSTQRHDCEKYTDSLLKQKDCTLKAQKEENSTPNIEALRYKLSEASATLQKPWQNATPVTTEESTSSNWTSRDYQIPISFHRPNIKNGTKRGYTEAMHDAARFNIANGITVAGKVAEGEAKTLSSKLQQGSYLSNYVPSKPSTSAQWMVGSEKSAIHPFVSRNEKATGENAPRPFNTLENCKDSAAKLPPPPKGQVVGWPPIRSYRKQNLAKPAEMFVKVNMDGITVGRKVDLNAHNSYECLYLALEEMFQLSSSGGQGTSQSVQGRVSQVHEVKQSRLLNGSEYVLTYEDQDGDWMMVGDVPWGMFVNMVRRLRITRKSEATGLGVATNVCLQLPPGDRKSSSSVPFAVSSHP